MDRFKVGKGQKVKNVKDENGAIRHYQSGEILPECYEPPKSFIEQRIVEKINNSRNTVDLRKTTVDKGVE
jgi:hypothetical protein